MMAESYNVVSTRAGSLPTSMAASYSCVFKNLWTEERHPAEFPDDAHWSPAVIGSHGPNYDMWLPGELASPGVERVAETGSFSTLSSEFNDEGADTNDFQTGSLFDAELGAFDILPEVQTTDEFPYISVISMIAPSPDWFSGFYNFDARNSDGTWYDEFIIQTWPWDAGTETGVGYSLSNPAEETHVPISQFTASNPISSGVFLSSDESNILPVARFECLQTIVAEETDPSMTPGSGESIVIDWFIPTETVTLPPLTANVGDTLVFSWTQFHNVYIHPNGGCDLTDRVLVGSTSGAQYTLTEADVGDIVFACDVGTHCQAGMRATVTVLATDSEPMPSPSPSDSTAEEESVCLAVGEPCAFGSSCCSGRCTGFSFATRKCRTSGSLTVKTSKLALSGNRGGAAGIAKGRNPRRLGPTPTLRGARK